MAGTLFAVKSNSDAAVQRVGHVDAFIVQANTSAEAKAIARAAAAVLGDGSDALWAAATVEDLSLTPDLAGWVFTVTLDALGTPKVLTYTGIAGDTVDLVGAGLAAAGVAISLTSSYNSGTNVLTVSSTGDAKGDKTLAAVVTPPATAFPVGTTVTTPFGTIVQSGSSGAATSVVLSLTWVIPSTIKQYKQSA